MKRAAVIYIDTSSIILTIAEKSKSEISILDKLHLSLNSTKITNSDSREKINFIEEIGRTMNRFMKVIKDYHVEEVKTVVPEGIIENLNNKEFFINLLKEKNDLELKILDKAQEKNLIFQAVIKKLGSEINLWDNKALLLHIGIGSLETGIISGQKIISSRSINNNLLNLKTKVKEITDSIKETATVVRDYFSGLTHDLKILLEQHNINCLLISGKGIETVVHLCDLKQQGGFYYIPDIKFRSLFADLKNKSPEQIKTKHNLDANEAIIVLPVIIFLKIIVELSAAKKIMAPVVSVEKIILQEMLLPQEHLKEKQNITQSIVLAAGAIGEKYKYNRVHSSIVTKFCLKIFDELQERLFWQKKHGLLLELAARLHDVGKFISVDNHPLHSFKIIKASSIPGLNKREIKIAACIAKFHGKRRLNRKDEDFCRLTGTEKILVGRLTAVLRIADALNKSHYNKFNRVQIVIKKNKLQITIHTNKETYLEEMTLRKKSQLFEEVFGLQPILQKKTIY